MASYLCYLLESGRVVETNDPEKLKELHICTETEFDNVIGEFLENTIEDIMFDEEMKDLEDFDPYEFCLEMMDESVQCDETGCWTTDDVLNAMCSEIWEDIAYEMGLLDEYDCDEDYCEEDEEW